MHLQCNEAVDQTPAGIQPTTHPHVAFTIVFIRASASTTFEIVKPACAPASGHETRSFAFQLIFFFPFNKELQEATGIALMGHEL